MTIATSLEALGWLLGLMTAVGVVSLVRRDVSTVDIFWGLGFLVAAWVYFGAAEVALARHVVVLGLVHLWGLRLSLYLLRRNCDADRRGKSFAWTSLFIVVSGVSLIERDLQRTKAGYRSYVARTSAFVPWLPRP